MTEPTRKQHVANLRTCLDLANQSPPKPTNFRVGALICSHYDPTAPKTLSTGYTLELEGNTHAEQCALEKLVTGKEENLKNILTSEAHTILYTSLEPCSLRLSGNLPCVQRIIATREGNPSGGIRKVVFGAREPGTFVKDSKSCQLLTEAGIDWEYFPDLEDEILGVAMEGHIKKADEQSRAELQPAHAGVSEQKGTNVDDISAEERRRQQALPRNPKKRMMDAGVPGNDAAIP